MDPDREHGPRARGSDPPLDSTLRSTRDLRLPSGCAQFHSIDCRVRRMQCCLTPEDRVERPADLLRLSTLNLYGHRHRYHRQERSGPIQYPKSRLVCSLPGRVTVRSPGPGGKTALQRQRSTRASRSLISLARCTRSGNRRAGGGRSATGSSASRSGVLGGGLPRVSKSADAAYSECGGLWVLPPCPATRRQTRPP